MSSAISSSSHKPHLRFYIFMVTLVVGGLFFLLYLNDDESSTGLISAISGYTNASEDIQVQTEEDLTQEFNKFVAEGSKNSDSHNVPLQLHFNKIPIVEKEAKISGTAKFEAGDYEVTIDSDKVTEDSLIYITPTTKTEGFTLYIKESNEGEGFVVALDKQTETGSEIEKFINPNTATPSASKSIRFNWLIINQR